MDKGPEVLTRQVCWGNRKKAIVAGHGTMRFVWRGWQRSHYGDFCGHGMKPDGILIIGEYHCRF